METLSKNLVQVLCRFLPIVDVMRMRQVSKWCHVMFSQQEIWIHDLSVRFNTVLRNKHEPIPEFTPALFCRLALRWPSAWTFEQCRSYLKQLVLKHNVWDPEGDILDVLARCSNCHCVRSHCNPKYVPIISHKRECIYVRGGPHGFYNVTWAMAKELGTIQFGSAPGTLAENCKIVLPWNKSQDLDCNQLILHFLCLNLDKFIDTV